MISYKYDSYGNIKQISGDLSLGNLNPFRYKGYYYDNESGMYYCKSRYYVAYWLLWLNMDRIEYLDNTNIGNINLFSYCNNNPVMMIDDKGNMPKWAKNFIIGGAIIAALAVATVVTAGIAGVGVGAAFGAGFTGTAIGSGASGLAATVAGSAFAGAKVGGITSMLASGVMTAATGGGLEQVLVHHLCLVLF